MATHEAPRSSAEEHGIGDKLRGMVLVAVLGAVGYVAVAIVAYSPPWLNAAALSVVAQFGQEDRMTNPDSEAAIAPEASVAIAAPLPEAASRQPMLSNRN